MKVEVLSVIWDKKGEVVKIVPYSARPVSRKKVIELYREGAPDSFDREDLREIKNTLIAIEEDSVNQDCLLAFAAGELVGAAQFYRYGGTWDNWEISYIFVTSAKQKSDIGKILCGVIEELLKKKARVVFAVVAGLLPHYANPYPFWERIGYREWGDLPGFFRDDLSGIPMVKRSPYYRRLKGIPEDDRWYPEMMDVRTGKRVTEAKYQQIVNAFQFTPKEKWGLDLIGRENVITWRV